MKTSPGAALRRRGSQHEQCSSEPFSCAKYQSMSLSTEIKFVLSGRESG